MRVGIPALAGLSILHGLVPPHPGPLVAIDALGADLGLTLLFGLIVAVPTLVICGPLLARFVEQWVPVHATDDAVARSPVGRRTGRRAPDPAGSSGPARGARGERTALAGTGHTASPPGRDAVRVASPPSSASPAGDPDARPSDRRAHHRRGHGLRSSWTFIGTPAVALLAAFWSHVRSRVPAPA